MAGSLSFGIFFQTFLPVFIAVSSTFGIAGLIILSFSIAFGVSFVSGIANPFQGFDVSYLYNIK